MNDTTLTIIDQEPAPLLSTRMTGLAQMYVDARRQQGEQLLVMARAVALAREEAQHGEWGIWLEAVQLQERAARRLIAVHNRASLSPKFAEAVRQNWFNASVAALVAERDDDEALLKQLLALPEPPSARQAQALANPATLPDLKPEPSAEEPLTRAELAALAEAGWTPTSASGAGLVEFSRAGSSATVLQPPSFYRAILAGRANMAQELGVVEPAAPVPGSEAPIIRILVERARIDGLNARATHDTAIGAGVLIWADDEDPDKLLPLPPDEAAAWLDRYEEEAAAQDVRHAPPSQPTPQVPAGWQLNKTDRGYFCADRGGFNFTNTCATAQEAIAEAIELSTEAGRKAHAAALHPPASRVNALSQQAQAERLPEPTYTIPAPAGATFDEDSFASVEILVDDLHEAMQAGDRGAALRTWLTIGETLLNGCVFSFSSDELPQALLARLRNKADADDDSVIAEFEVALGGAFATEEVAA